MANLTSAEIEAFLAEPRTAHLVTLRASGTPHVAPVWFLWKGGRALVMADASAVKVRNIRRNPAVALSVATPDPPTLRVHRGTANIASEGLSNGPRDLVLYGARSVGRVADECWPTMTDLTPIPSAASCLEEDDEEAADSPAARMRLGGRQHPVQPRPRSRITSPLISCPMS